MPRNVTIDKSKRFPNGVFIFDSGGVQIDPNSEQGKIIVRIYEIQEEIRKLNGEQQKQGIRTTFPRDPAKQAEYRKKFGLV